MNNDQLKHLDYIQAIITRLNSNSFMIKGWCITITSALLALSASSKNTAIMVVAYIPIIVFWLLDSFYLQTERKFRGLYKEAINTPSQVSLFDLNIERDFITDDKKNSFWSVAKSNTIAWFYSSLLILTIACTLFFVLDSSKDPAPQEVKVNFADTLLTRHLSNGNYLRSSSKETSNSKLSQNK